MHGYIYLCTFKILILINYSHNISHSNFLISFFIKGFSLKTQIIYNELIETE